MKFRMHKYTNIKTSFYLRNIKDGITILPYLCFDKCICTGNWEINMGWIIFGCTIEFDYKE